MKKLSACILILTLAGKNYQIFLHLFFILFSYSYAMRTIENIFALAGYNSNMVVAEI